MSPSTPRSSRNRQIAIGAAAALAVAVGGGAYLAGSHDDGVTEETTAIAPAASPAPAPPPAPATTEPGVAGPGAAGPGAATAKRTQSAGRLSPEPPGVRAEVDAARSRAAEAGQPLQRPLTASASPKIAAQNADSLVEEERPLPDGGTLRITSARYDLSGQREMLWAADSGTAAGAARCTQNFRFAQGQRPAVRENMLLCWRNTADRSVLVLAVTRTGTPNTAQILNVLDTQWDRL